MTMRVSLPGYDALTDGTIDHYSIYADSDNILIKEFTRGTINLAGSGGAGTITHSLGYIPHSMVYVNNSGKFGFVSGADMNSSYPVNCSSGTGNLIIRNNFAGTATKTFYYYIFYDKGLSL